MAVGNVVLNTHITTMAAPQNMNTKDISGVFSMSKSLSSDMDEVFQLARKIYFYVAVALLISADSKDSTGLRARLSVSLL